MKKNTLRNRTRACKAWLQMSAIAILMGLPGLQVAAQTAGEALDFDGANDHVNMNANPILNAGSATIEAWVKPITRSDAGSWMDFPNNVISDDNPGYYGRGFGVNVLSGGSGVVIEYNDGFHKFSYPFTSGTWYHVAVVYTTSKVVTYINGVQENTLTLSNGASDHNILHIGKHNNDAGYGTRRFFKGAIDEVRLWNIERTGTEIANTMNKELLGSECGLRAYYKFNQGSAGGTNTSETTLTNAVSSSFHGTLADFALSGSSSNWVGSGSGVSTNSTSAPADINVKGNGTNPLTIATGDITPSFADSTRFGAVASGTTRAFRIENTGTLSLDISSVVISGANATDFQKSSVPSTINGNSSAILYIKYVPSASGNSIATVTINSSDCDESAYSFAISASNWANCAMGTTVWDGGGSDENYSTKENWVGDLCPCRGERVVFNATGANTKNCLVDSSITMLSITMQRGYRGRMTINTACKLTVDSLISTAPTIAFAAGSDQANIGVLNVSNNGNAICASNSGISIDKLHVGLAGYISFRSKSTLNVGSIFVDEYSQFKGPTDGNIYLTGNLYIANRNTFDGAGATLRFTGTGNQNVEVLSAGVIKTMPLVVNKASGAVVLLRNLNTDHLTLTSGNINTGSNRLTLTAPGGLFGGSSSSYINGKVGIDHSSAWPGSKMRLPMGKGSKYRPITLHNTSSINTWEVEFMNSDPNGLGSPNAPLSDISADGYWSANRTAGGGGLLADATYFEISDAGNPYWYYDDLRVALYDGSDWNDIGGSFTTDAVISSDNTLRGNTGYLLALGTDNGIPAPHVLVDGDLVSGKELRTAATSSITQVAASRMLSFNVYPNPVAETLNINLSGADKGSITLSDLSGKVLGVYSADTRSIDMSRFAAGVYFATFSNGSQRIAQRVIKH